jgi:hypothetical protein
MDPKNTSDIAASLSPEQQKLVSTKMDVLRKARDLQTQLSQARAELTRIDQDMLKSGFKIPVLACW